MRTKILTAGLLLLGVACNTLDSNDVPSRAKAWKAQGITDYVFVWFEGCFCDIPDGGGVRVVVRGDLPVDGRGVKTGLPLPNRLKTIDDVFDIAERAADEDPDEYEIHYDPEHHFPTKLVVDPDSGAEDDSLTLEIRCFSLDVADGCPVTTLTEAECAQAHGTPTAVMLARPESTCGGSFPGAIGRISTDDRVCCSSTH